LYGYASAADSQFVLLCTYRPGSDPPMTKFFDELSTVIEQLVSYRRTVVVCGDFNDTDNQASGRAYGDAGAGGSLING